MFRFTWSLTELGATSWIVDFKNSSFDPEDIFQVQISFLFSSYIISIIYKINLTTNTYIRRYLNIINYFIQEWTDLNKFSAK